MASELLEQQSLERVSQGCLEDTQRGRGAERGFCYELFRRALDLGDQAAWALILRHYRLLLLKWVQEAAPLVVAAEYGDELALAAFGHFWSTQRKQAGALASRFGHIGALLNYLKRCAITAVSDHQRGAQRRTRLLERLQASGVASAAEHSPEELAIDTLCRDDTIAAVRQWLASSVTDPHEQLVIELSFGRELTPAQIAASYPEQFASVAVVHTIKERVLKRARRAFLPSRNG